ncbi:molybdate ABC transporter substrate-binding protein [Limnohabitans sp.]|uniref:molybdate ABC transporter substrate-binding protein n=1 Tax=Limnohabitans sp. TaxID=1907725 RepID=UPI0038B9CA7A
MTRLTTQGIRLLATVLMALSASAQAVELKVISGNGSRPAVMALCQQFEAATGHKVTVEFAVNPRAQKKIQDGEAFDVTVLNPPTLDRVIQSGHVQADSRRVIGRIGLGVGIRQGAPKPDIRTVEGFKQTLLATRSVAYPGEGASGIYFESLIQRLGLGAEMKPRMRPMSGEYNVEGVARGEVDMVVVVASRMYGVPGVEVVGLIPDALQTWIGFATAVATRSAHPSEAQALVRFMTSPPADQTLRPIGIEPFVDAP